MVSIPDRSDEEMAEVTRLLDAGKLKVRLDEDGKILPDKIDVEEVERDHPNSSPAEKRRLAQACCLLRAKREYDQRNEGGPGKTDLGRRGGPRPEWR